MTTLIQRAEQAATPQEALALFIEHEHQLSLPVNHLFNVWMQGARNASTRPMLLGYLLLAAMAVVPEGDWTLDLCVCPEMGAIARVYPGPVRENSAGEATGRGNHLCTALLAALLKTGQS